jgi:hypothetical protein
MDVNIHSRHLVPQILHLLLLQILLAYILDRPARVCSVCVCVVCVCVCVCVCVSESDVSTHAERGGESGLRSRDQWGGESHLTRRGGRGEREEVRPRVERMHAAEKAASLFGRERERW